MTDYAEKALSAYQSTLEVRAEEHGLPERARWMGLFPLTEKIRLLKRCREIGIEAAFDEKGGKLAEDWVITFMGVQSWASRSHNWVDIKELLTGGDLSSPQAREFLAEAQPVLSFEIGEEGIGLDRMLDRIEREGAEAAFADLLEFGADIPEMMKDRLRSAIACTKQYRETGDRISLNEAVAAWDSVIRDPGFTDIALHARRIYISDAAEARDARFREREDSRDLDIAIELWQQYGDMLSSAQESVEFLHFLGVSCERGYGKQLSEAEKIRAHDSAQALGHLQRAYEYLDQAIHQYEKAYEAADEATQGAPPAPTGTDEDDAFSGWLFIRKQKARYKNSAGLAYKKKYGLSGDTEELNRAIESLRSATKISEEHGSPVPFLYDDLAGALVARVRKLRQQDDLVDAISAYERSLELCDDSEPIFGVESATNYGLLLNELDELQRARTILELAHEWAEMARAERTSHKARLELAAYTAPLYRTLVYCCLQESDLKSAFMYASAGKGRTFVDMLARARITVESALSQHPNIDHLNDYVSVRNDIGRLRADYRSEGEKAQQILILERIQERLRKEKILWEDLSSRYRSLAAVENAEPPLDVEAAQGLARELHATLIEYYRHYGGWCAFVVTAKGFECKSLPGLDDRLLRKLADWTENFRLSAASEKGLLTEWHTAALRPILDDLRKSERAILAPSGAMHSMPFYAAIDAETGRYAIDDGYELCFVSSLAALNNLWVHRGLANAAPHTVQRVLGVAYSGERGRDFLANAADETKDSLGCFPNAIQSILSEEQATPDEVISRAKEDQDIVHLSCHGFFDSDFPDQSGLLLASGWLTVRRILTEMNFDRAPLVTLSACDTARTRLGAGDELNGLSQAILAAGARCVASTLWRANDSAARELFVTFYKHVANGVAPVSAMREAALAVRRNEEWSHPRYWSPFVVIGLGMLGPSNTQEGIST
ncbi:CHAT domain-containing protein [Streptomyces inhibens]|uniref:CHAT domain-containing protein n=1 Tax=Streptomyces inhibens TaxID=2293571 RepID=UPI00402A82A7